MIITYPIQIPYSRGDQQRVVPDSIYNNSEILSGSFPMGKNRFWHGGVHLHPSDRNAPIRAIADGELLAYRYDETDTTDDFFNKEPYSRSFVLLKHETELGQTTLGNNKLTFYSLYMHLQEWSGIIKKKNSETVNFHKKLVPEKAKMGNAGPLLDTQKKPMMIAAHYETEAPNTNGVCNSGDGCGRVKRGDILGYCGRIPDNNTMPSCGIHFEIFFDDIAFLDNPNKAVWGKVVLAEPLLAFDELLKKKSMTVDPRKPLLANAEQGSGNYIELTIEKHNVWVCNDQLTTEEVDISDKKHKGQRPKIKQYKARNEIIETYNKNPENNSNMLAKGLSIIPWMDPWLKSGEFREEINDNKTWVQIYLPESQKLVWAEKICVKYSSDADWPDFHKLQEHGQFSEDGFVDDPGLQKIIVAYDQDRAEKNKEKIVQDEDKLRHFVARHPTEWSKQDISKRFQRVTTDDFGSAKLSPDQFTKLTKHIERLSFWEAVPPLPSANHVWHAHPVKFIEHLAKCMWLSKDELTLIYPEKSSVDPKTISHGTAENIRETYRLEINKCCFKYGINTRLRLSHFFGQGAIECESLNSMTEISSGDAYEGNADLGNISQGDGKKFKGRGFKQITGRYNYAKYWEFRGWLIKGFDFDGGWERNANRRAPKIDDPGRIIENPYNCIDTGAWYGTFFRRITVQEMDNDNVRAVTHAINGGKDTMVWEQACKLKERNSFTKRIKGELF